MPGVEKLGDVFIFWSRIADVFFEMICGWMQAKVFILIMLRLVWVSKPAWHNGGQLSFSLAWKMQVAVNHKGTFLAAADDSGEIKVKL